MLFVKTKDLKPGMRLAKPIYNKMGVMLYERDTKLNMQGIESIRNFNLIGIYILEPAEPVPPLSEEDIAFEQFQTVSLFQLRSIMEQICNDKQPAGLNELVNKIIIAYGSLDHKLNFTQNLRSSGDFTYKHAISTAILAAMICHSMAAPYETQAACVTAALLYDIGYLLVSPDIIEKGSSLTPSDQRIIQECRKNGYEKLNPKTHGFLDKATLKMISQLIYLTNPAGQPEGERIPLLKGTRILYTADAFDRMTAMSLNEEPVSEIVAIRYLFDNPNDYEPRIVNALSKSINILPVGSCVDLSTNAKAMIIAENPDNFMLPLVLTFSDNRVYDLGDPATNSAMQIVDIMKTMDNRILIDETSLKHFYADDVIKKAADEFRRKKAELVKKGRYDPTAPVHQKPARSAKPAKPAMSADEAAIKAAEITQAVNLQSQADAALQAGMAAAKARLAAHSIPSSAPADPPAAKKPEPAPEAAPKKSRRKKLK